MADTTHEPTEQEIRDVLPDLTCATCQETRNVLDFYDDLHTVNLTVDDPGGNEQFGVVVDHGEMSLERARRDL